MKILSDDELSDLGFNKHHMSTLNFHLLRAVAQEQDKYTLRQIMEWIEKEFGYFTDKGLEKIVIDDYGYYGREGSMAKWQELKADIEL